jgi:glycyl-tRNA synthetase beta chain
LRRAGNGVIKILAESNLGLTLDHIFAAVKPQINELTVFLIERLRFYLIDVRGFTYDVANAVTSAGDLVVKTDFTVGTENVRHTVARAEALTLARKSEDFTAVCAAFKRIKNILEQAEEKKFAVGNAGDVKLAPEAQRLADASAALAPKVAGLREQRAYGEALTAIATLRPTVDAFFDKVMVLDPDEKLRGAHLGLIDEVLRNFSTIADFSEIVTAATERNA